MLKLVRLILLTALSAAACSRTSGKPPDTELSEEKFIAVMVDLGFAQPAQKPAILQKHRVTQAQLQKFVRAYEEHPAALGVVFDSIQRGLDRRRTGLP